MLALLIGVVTVVIGCWLSDNCWSPEPEHVVTVAWPSANSGPPPDTSLTPVSIVSISTSSRSSSPESDWPLVDLSDEDSMNLWHHSSCDNKEIISNETCDENLINEIVNLNSDFIKVLCDGSICSKTDNNTNGSIFLPENMKTGVEVDCGFKIENDVNNFY